MVVNYALDKSKVLLSKQKLVKFEDSDETLPPDCDSLQWGSYSSSFRNRRQSVFVSEIN